MKRLVLQTYIEDNIKRDTVNTYKRFPKLERLSKKCFQRYAQLHGADYELFTVMRRTTLPTGVGW